LIRSLQENHVPHNFLFRTFGGDGMLIKRYLEQQFQQMQLRDGRFDKEGAFHYQDNGIDVVIKDPDEFKALIKTGHWLIQDNFERWRDGKEKGNFGKLFPYHSDLQDRVLSLFADDNLEIVSSGEQRTIVCCYDSEKKTFTSTQSASSHLIKVNPIDAALDPDYLTSKVSKVAEQLLIPFQRRTLIMRMATISIVVLAGIIGLKFGYQKKGYA
jgi:hypothetical protein